MTAFADMQKVSSILRLSSDGRLFFNCPGCRRIHGPSVGTGPGPRWSFNGDYENPTFRPSLLVKMPPSPQATREPYISGWVCHSWVTNGEMEFLNDCTHELAGKTVYIPLWEDDEA